MEQGLTMRQNLQLWSEALNQRYEAPTHRLTHVVVRQLH